MGITRDPFAIPHSTDAWAVIVTLIVSCRNFDLRSRLPSDEC